MLDHILVAVKNVLKGRLFEGAFDFDVKVEENLKQGQGKRRSRAERKPFE